MTARNKAEADKRLPDIVIYNTLTGRKEKFVPITPGVVRMYVCGPTVYDYIHIGNARPLIFFDVVHRYFEAVGYDVTFVQNFTDVDDKLIRKAQETDSTVPEVAERYIAAFFEDVAALGLKEADAHPRVTDSIPEIIEFIEGLIEKGYAYESEGDVYFRTRRFRDYGKLSGQNLEELHFGKRIEIDERKEHPEDFVLWKCSKPGEIFWPSSWGNGRPGWHIECSAMVAKYLGETIDIHGGGHDLQFPHHECEIAQSEALHDKPLANYWMHNGYIQINNEKMSKSLGNGVNVREVVRRYKPAAFRYFMLSTHYRSPLNYSDDIMTMAEQSIARIEHCLLNLEHRLQTLTTRSDGSAIETALQLELEPADQRVMEQIGQILQRFHAKMKDDFNTADALTAMFDLVAEANRYLQTDAVHVEVVERLIAAFHEMNQVLGILSEQGEVLLDEEIEALIEERNAARAAKNWARADEIRDQLLSQGIVLEDTPQGIRWRRK